MTEASEISGDLTPLLTATADGDQTAFAELYSLTSANLYALLLRILKRREWAEEALQDCYVRIWQKADSYEPGKGKPMTWLMTIARYRALDLLRMRRPEFSASDIGDGDSAVLEVADERLDPERGAAEAQGVERLDECMDTLGDEQKRSVLLAYYEGCSHSDIAQKLKSPLGTVKSWVRRGLQQLRDCLGGN